MTPTIEQWTIIIITYVACLFLYVGIVAYVIFLMSWIAKFNKTFDVSKVRVFILRTAAVILLPWFIVSTLAIFYLWKTDMTTGQLIGLVGGVAGGGVGGAGGILGGIVGSYCSIVNTNGPKERAFVVKGTIISSIICVVAVALMILLMPYGALVWVVLAPLMGFGIPYWNKKQMQIRQQEMKDNGGTP